MKPITDHLLTPARIVGGLLLMIIVPSECLALAAIVDTVIQGSDTQVLEIVVILLVFAPPIGLVLGCPWLLTGAALWAVLERTGHARAQPALVGGMLIGATATPALSLYAVSFPWLVQLAVCATIGALTGLAVWWAAHFKLPPPR